jgi:hypothetical protein
MIICVSISVDGWLMLLLSIIVSYGFDESLALMEDRACSDNVI